MAHATYEDDGTVTFNTIPTAQDASPPGFIWTENASTAILTLGQSVLIVNLRYHNNLENLDPYYRVTDVWNDTLDSYGVTIPAKSYYYIYSNEDGNYDNSFIVFVNKDDEIICSAPEAGSWLDSHGETQAATCYYDYDFWRISPAYMPNLVPSN